MSFSLSVKNEVAKVVIEDYDLILAELAGFAHVCSSLKYRSGRFYIVFDTENAAVARRIFTFLKRFFNLNVSVVREKSKGLKQNLYRVSLDDYSSNEVLFSELDFMGSENVFMPKFTPKFIESANDARAYLRASFLGGGSVIDPKKSYHLEIVLKNEEHAQFLMKMCEICKISGKITTRKERPLFYLKKAEDISDFLSLIGGYKSMLKFENTRVIKDMRNRINRLVNCETANLNRTLEASLRQIEDINLIDNSMGISNLPENLRIIAEYRRKNPELSLEELGKMFDKPLSKSTINYRLKRLKDIADNLRSDTID